MSFAVQATNKLRFGVVIAEVFRNNTLNREVFGIAQLATSGEISEQDSLFIPTNLLLAANRLRSSKNEVLKTFNSAWEAGISVPRHPIKVKAEAVNDEEYRQAFRPVNITGFINSKIEPTKFSIQQILSKRHITLLSGHGGIGKSALWQHMLPLGPTSLVLLVNIVQPSISH